MASKQVTLPDFATAGEQCKQYAAILAKDAELHRRREEINSEIAEIRARNPRGFGIMAEVTPHQNPAAEKQESPVAKLLGQFMPAKVDTPVSGNESDLHRSRELSTEGQQIDDARRILDDQRYVLHRKASREYCDVILPDYRPLAANVAQALIMLGKALEAHDAFLEDVQRHNVQSSYLLVVERPSWAKIVRWLRSAVDGNHLDAREIPEEWKVKA